MLTTVTRAPTKAELDAYSERMASRVVSLVLLVGLAVIVGGLAAMLAFGVVWLHTVLVSGAVSWKVPLIVGGVLAVLAFVLLWFIDRGDGSWTVEMPEVATEVTATADAAWDTDSDSLEFTLVLRVEPDRYLLITHDAWTPPFQEEKAADAGDDTIPSNIRLVLMGEGKSRVAMNVSLGGPAIPRPTVDAMPADTGPERDDRTPPADGVYAAAELPARIREAIGLGE